MTFLEYILQKHLGPPVLRTGGRSFWYCPNPGHDDCTCSFCTRPHDPKFKDRFQCYGCSIWGDELDALRTFYPGEPFHFRQDRLLDLRKEYEATLHRNRDVKKDSPKRKRSPGPKPWWAMVVRTSALRMFQKPYRPVLKYLRDRGLRDQTLRSARIGVNEEGVLIPWFDSPKREIVAVNVRRFRGDDPKYRLYEGSSKGGLYPDGRLDPTGIVMLCEGELDTLLARQELKGIQAVTLGSSGDRPSRKTLSILGACPHLIVAYDADSAGDASYEELRKVLPQARRARPPEGMDVTEMYLDGSLGEWTLRVRDRLMWSLAMGGTV